MRRRVPAETAFHRPGTARRRVRPTSQSNGPATPAVAFPTSRSRADSCRGARGLGSRAAGPRAYVRAWGRGPAAAAAGEGSRREGKSLRIAHLMFKTDIINIYNNNSCGGIARLILLIINYQ